MSSNSYTDVQEAHTPQQSTSAEGVPLRSSEAAATRLLLPVWTTTSSSSPQRQRPHSAPAWSTGGRGSRATRNIQRERPLCLASPAHSPAAQQNCPQLSPRFRFSVSFFLLTQEEDNALCGRERRPRRRAACCGRLQGNEAAAPAAGGGTRLRVLLVLAQGQAASLGRGWRCIVLLLWLRDLERSTVLLAWLPGPQPPFGVRHPRPAPAAAGAAWGAVEALAWPATWEEQEREQASAQPLALGWSCAAARLAAATPAPARRLRPRCCSNPPPATAGGRPPRLESESAWRWTSTKVSRQAGERRGAT